jgi:hypothetical protein
VFLGTAGMYVTGTLWTAPRTGPLRGSHANMQQPPGTGAGRRGGGDVALHRRSSAGGRLRGQVCDPFWLCVELLWWLCDTSSALPDIPARRQVGRAGSRVWWLRWPRCLAGRGHRRTRAPRRRRWWQTARLVAQVVVLLMMMTWTCWQSTPLGPHHAVSPTPTTESPSSAGEAAAVA